MTKLLLLCVVLLPGCAASQSQQAMPAPFPPPQHETTAPKLAPIVDTSPGIRASTREVHTLDNTRLRIATVIAAAEEQIGAPYRYGGTTPAGFDCSGFVRYVFAGVGISLPHSARTIAKSGVAVAADPRALVPGDLVFLNVEGRGIDHVAIYAGNGRVIHATSKGGGVRYDNITSDRGRWIVRHLVSARRIVRGRKQS